MTSIAFIASCTNKGNVSGASAQNDKPNTDYKPSFAGQTRIKQIVTATPYKVAKIAEKLGKPWAIIPLPDGRLMMTEKSGFITIHSADGVLLKKVNLEVLKNIALSVSGPLMKVPEEYKPGVSAFKTFARNSFIAASDMISQTAKTSGLV